MVAPRRARFYGGAVLNRYPQPELNDVTRIFNQVSASQLLISWLNSGYSIPNIATSFQDLPMHAAPSLLQLWRWGCSKAFDWKGRSEKDCAAVQCPWDERLPVKCVSDARVCHVIVPFSCFVLCKEDYGWQVFFHVRFKAIHQRRIWIFMAEYWYMYTTMYICIYIYIININIYCISTLGMHWVCLWLCQSCYAKALEHEDIPWEKLMFIDVHWYACSHNYRNSRTHPRTATHWQL